MNGVKETFYVALFSNEELTKRVGDIVPIKFNGESSKTVTLNNVPLDRVLYVGEVDKNGNLINSGVTSDGGIYGALFTNGNVIKLTTSIPEKNVGLENVFSEIPTDY